MRKFRKKILLKNILKCVEKESSYPQNLIKKLSTICGNVDNLAIKYIKIT